LYKINFFKKKHIDRIAIILLILLTLSIFIYTVLIRSSWFGVLSPGHHQWLTGHAILHTKNWYNEGALKLRFGFFENPNSVEFPTLESRVFYFSYPPGALIPIYLISKLIAQEPNPALVMAYNLSNHFFITLFLSLTIFFFLNLVQRMEV